MEGILHFGPTARRLRAKDGSGGGNRTHLKKFMRLLSVP